MPTNLKKWDVENQDFWESTGKTIANKNLWLSIPALFLSFATWAMWGVIIKYMKDFGYNFGMTEGLLPGSEEYKAALSEVNSLYYSLPAIAGLAGATLRIPNSFLISLGGGRNVIFFSALLMLIPAIGTGWALSDINTTYYMFASMALLSGFGGGNFASSMSNISFFFPKRVQGYALGMNAGIGNLGVGAMQKIIPLVIGLSLFGAIGSEAIVKEVPFDGLQNASGFGEGLEGSSGSVSGIGGGLTGLVSEEKATPEELAKPFFWLLLVQGFFAGLVIGKLAEGKIKAGLKHSFTLVIIALLISTGANVFLGGVG